uniref:Trehalose-6-phosphate synthase n=1 Tax=Triatoma infestans TaxID=30076 RepID=A0A170ULP0_TRIIF
MFFFPIRHLNFVFLLCFFYCLI